MKIILTEKETNVIDKIFISKKIKSEDKSIFEIIKDKFIIGTVINERGNTTLSIRPDFFINIAYILEEHLNTLITIYRKLSFESELGIFIKKAVFNELVFMSRNKEEDTVYKTEYSIDDVIDYINTNYFHYIKYQFDMEGFITHMNNYFGSFSFELYSANKCKACSLIITDLCTLDKFNYRFITPPEGEFSIELISKYNKSTKKDEPIQILVEDEYEKIRNSSIIKAVEDLLVIGTKDINQIVGFLDGQTPDTMNRIITSTKPTNFLYINDKDLGSFRYDIVTKEIVINPDQMVDYLKYFVEDESEKVNDIVEDNNEVVYLFGIIDNNICVETKENNDLHSAIESTIDIRRRCKHKDQDGFNAIIINENNEFVCKVCGSIFERRL